jgi:hypothetical protein
MYSLVYLGQVETFQPEPSRSHDDLTPALFLLCFCIDYFLCIEYIPLSIYGNK